MKIKVGHYPPPRHGPRPSSRSAGSRSGDQASGSSSSTIRLPSPDLGEGAVLRIVRPTRGGSIRTLMSGTSWTATTAYMSARNRRTTAVEAATALIAAHVDEVDTTTVRSWSEPMRVELHTAHGRWSTIIDRARQKDHGGLQLSELKARWDGFSSERARIQVRLGRLAADALGAEHVCEVPASLGSLMLRRNAAAIQTYRFVQVPISARYVAAEMLVHRGTVALGELAEALSSHRANGIAMACSLMVQRLVRIDLETRLGDDSPVTSVPPLPPHMPDLFDALAARTGAISDAA